jgi:outer membrane protein OmpA-like peptidoglycan-associated protein
VQSQIGVLEGGSDTSDRSVELLFGGRYDVSRTVLLEAGTSTGLVRGIGSPDWRVFAGVSVHAAPREPEDTDGDGYLDPEDACPLEPEDFDGFEDAEGCPDYDNDGDGVLDVDDGPARDDGFGVCLNDPEDADGFEDENGCPDPDNDGDTVPDIRDGLTGDDGFGVCMNDPEDTDGFEDTDGCPDPDNDEDGVPDIIDGEVQHTGFGACMNDPEDMDGDRDTDGCPEEDRAARITCDEIIIDGRVYFDLDSDVIQTRSFGVLDDVASVLDEADFIRLLSVEGHTDSQGSSRYNLDLSERRAASVMRYLGDRGIEGDRLISGGWGEEEPIDTNGTDEGRQNNRRVEFIIAEQDKRACVE